MIGELPTIDYSNFDHLLEKYKDVSDKFLKDALLTDNEAVYDPYYFKYKNAPEKKAMKRRLLRYKMMKKITFGKKRRRYKEKIGELKFALSMLR